MKARIINIESRIFSTRLELFFFVRDSFAIRYGSAEFEASTKIAFVSNALTEFVQRTFIILSVPIP